MQALKSGISHATYPKGQSESVIPQGPVYRGVTVASPENRELSRVDSLQNRELNGMPDKQADNRRETLQTDRHKKG
jgi:hypothetical protein